MSVAISDVDVELIVAEVVRRLRQIDDKGQTKSAVVHQANGSTGDSVKPPSISKEKQGTNEKQSDEELRLTEPVVTLASLHGRMTGKRRVLVAPQAVVTPAARDELRKAGISLERARGSSSKTPSVMLINLAFDVDVHGIAAALTDHGQPVTIREEKELSAAVRKLDSELRSPNDLGAIVTRHPEIALIAANRLRRLRAIQPECGKCRKRLKEKIGLTGANVLIIDPTGRGERELVDLLLEFRSEMPRQIPAVFV